MSRQVHTIGLLLSSPTDRRLLADSVVALGHQVRAPQPAKAHPEEWDDISLVIADEAAGHQHKEALLALKARSEENPFLLLWIALPQQADSTPWLEIGFDDVLRLPMTKPDLHARLVTFLRLREQLTRRASQGEAMFRAVEHHIPGTRMNVTDRKRVEEALRESEERLRTLMNAMPDIVCFKDGEGRWLEANKADLQLFQLESVDYRGKKDSELAEFSPFYREAFLTCEETDQKAWHRRTISRGEEVIPTPEGVAKVYDVIKVPLFYPDGRRKGLVVLGRDITERKQVEEALRHRTEQLEALRQVGLALTAELDLDVLLRAIVSRAVELVGGDSGGLYLYRPEQDALEWTVTTGPYMTPTGTTLRRGEGLSGKVWESGKPLIVDDYQHWNGRAAVYEGYPFKAVVGVPVRWGEEFLGVVDVLANTAGAFSPADADLLSLFASQAAVAIQNARLFERERKQRELAQALAEAAMAVSSTLNLDRVLDRILEQVDRVIPCDATNIMLVESGRARVVRWRGYERFGAEEFVSQVVFPITEVPNLQHMVETGEPMFITDTATYPGWVRVPVQAWLRSYAAAPIHVRDQVVGFLNVDSATPGHFSTADVQILRVFAAHAAAAIENAQLYQDVRDYAEQLEQRVAERTAQLSERMAEVERLNRTLTNLLEDLQAANRNLEEITEELQKANDELEAFAYSVSHDLRAPLRAMQGFAEALLEDYGNSLDAVGQEYAQRIVVAAQRMDALIQDLLAYSRLGRAEIRLQPLSLDQVVDEVLTQLEARIREQEAQVTVEKPLPEVLGHHTTMVQVVSNLLTNALKFVTPGVRPEVRIWAEEQPVGAASQGPSAAQRSAARVRLWVEDNGIGIAPEHQERIFRVFERLHGIETYPGTGIGLAIVRRAMEHMGGRVGVESEVGHGSRFWVELDKA